MLHRTILTSAVLLAGAAGLLEAQSQHRQEAGPHCPDTSTKVGCVLPRIGGAGSFVLPPSATPGAVSHEGHFSNVAQTNFTPLNSALATQLASLPFASPASGFSVTFDSAVGVFTRSAQSLGSILTERGETIGRRKFVLGAAYQFFSFDKLDSVRLDNVPAIFVHEDDPPGTFAFKDDVISTRNNIGLKVHQFTLFGTFGLTNRIDIAVAAPITDVRMTVSTDAAIVRVADKHPVFGHAHYFDLNDQDNSTFRPFRNYATASGLGDLTVRLKGTVLRGERSALALASDFRLPTGDEMNFLGAGAVGFRPFVAFSTAAWRLGPHFNLGYQWNGSSALAGNLSTGEKARLPNQFSYAFGTDLAASRRVTLAFDVLGHRILNAHRIVPSEVNVPRHGVFRDLRLEKSSFNMLDGAVGGKVSLPGRLLLTLNVMTRLNSGGLRAKVVPMAGLAYTF